MNNLVEYYLPIESKHLQIESYIPQKSNIHKEGNFFIKEKYYF